MKVIVKLKSTKECHKFDKIWEIQSNAHNNGKEFVLVGYDHEVHLRIDSKDIDSVHVAT